MCAGGGGIQGGQRRLIGAGVPHRAIVAFLAQGHEIEPEAAAARTPMPTSAAPEAITAATA